MKQAILWCFMLLFFSVNNVIGVHAVTTSATFPALESLTLENFDRLVQLAGELTEVNEGFNIARDGSQIAVARPDGIELYAMGNFEAPIAVFPVEDMDQVYGPEISPDGSLLIASMFKRGTAGAITRLWDIQSGTFIRDFESAYPLNGGGNFSPDGQFLMGYDTLAYTCDGGCDNASDLYIWSLAESEAETSILRCPFLCHARYVLGDAEFSPDSKILFWSSLDYGASEDEFEFFWQAEYLTVEQDTGIITPLMTNFAERSGPFAGKVYSLNFSPDGTLLSARNKDTAADTLWDVQTGLEILTLPDEMQIRGFLSDQLLVLQDYDSRKSVFLMDAATGEQVTSKINFGNAYVFPAGSNNNLLTAISNGRLAFYGVPTQ